MPKTRVQRLENWKIVLPQYDYTTLHISGERNCLGDLLSRWVNVPVVTVRAVAVFAGSAPVETMPSKDAIREVQQQGRAGLSVGWSRARLGDRDMLWIPEQAKEMQMRLMVCAHMKDAGHRRVVATSQRLQGYCWFSMKIHVKSSSSIVYLAWTRRRVRKPREYCERRCTGGDLARFCISTTFALETAVPWVRMNYMRETGSSISWS